MNTKHLPQPTPSILGGAWTILRARWHVAKNSFWRGKLLRKLITVLTIVVVGAVSYGLYWFSGLIVRSLQTLGRDAPNLVDQLGSVDRIFAAVPSVALAAFALPLLLSSVSFALSTLYLSRDLETLLVTPVPVRSVFLARFLEGLASTYILLFALLAPALAGYGQALGYGVGFFFAIVIVLLLLPLLPVSIGTLLTMVLVRIIPPKRLREVLTVIGGLFGLIVYIGSLALTRPGNNLARPETAEQLLRFDVPALPTSWGARFLVAAGTGDVSRLLLFGGLYTLATLGLFVVCLAVAERLYYGGWIGMAGTQGGRVRQRHQARRVRPPLLRGAIGAIVLKDVRVLPRDLQQLSQLLVPLAISVYWIWRLVTDTGFGGALGPSSRTAATGLVSIGVFVCVLISSHLGLTGLSREAKGYWLLHLAPISEWTIIWAKWLLAWLPFPLIGTLFVGLIGVLQRPPVGTLIQDWFLILLTGFGVAGITTGFGAIFPRFNWEQPKTMTSGRAGCIGSILYLLYTGLMLLLIEGTRYIAPRLGNWVYPAGWGVALLLTALAMSLPLALAASRLRKLEP